jgi:hypothetical protein
MKDLIVPVNNEALSRVLLAIVGPDTTKTIVEAYKHIDAAMLFGYERGIAAGDAMRKAAAEEYVSLLGRMDANASVAFNEGYEDGAAEAIKNLKELTDEEAEKHYEAGTIAGRADGFKAGYDAGCLEASTLHAHNNQSWYDDGYVDGVADARGCPQYADEQIARLCEQDEFDDLEPKVNAAVEGAEYYPDDTIDRDFDWGDTFDAIVARGEQPEYSRDGERLY